MSEFERKEYSPMRKAISNAMKGSLQNGSQLTLGTTFDATNLLAVRSEIKNNHESLGVANASINEIIMAVLAKVIKANTTLNGQIGDNYFDEYSVVHMAFACDTPRGLLTPTIKDIDSKTLTEVSNEAKELIAKAMDGKLTMPEMTGGTFTITNMGLSGVQFFTPVINPPQAAILGIGSPTTNLKLVDGEVKEYKEITLSLTMDHGPNDGVAGGQLLKEIATALASVDNSIIK